MPADAQPAILQYYSNAKRPIGLLIFFGSIYYTDRRPLLVYTVQCIRPVFTVGQCQTFAESMLCVGRLDGAAVTGTL